MPDTDIQHENADDDSQNVTSTGFEILKVLLGVYGGPQEDMMDENLLAISLNCHVDALEKPLQYLEDSNLIFPSSCTPLFSTQCLKD